MCIVPLQHILHLHTWNPTWVLCIRTDTRNLNLQIKGKKNSNTYLHILWEILKNKQRNQSVPMNLACRATTTFGCFPAWPAATFLSNSRSFYRCGCQQASKRNFHVWMLPRVLGGFSTRLTWMGWMGQIGSCTASRDKNTSLRSQHPSHSE